ncbi:MAG: toll/interleukin-1 receptor domain-containing protein [Muribaculaceae bacterium]
MAKYDIFISYRREGGYDTAKHLYDLLTRDGYNVSFDIDTLRSGDFDKSLLTRIDSCTDFILIIDAHAFDRTLDPNFNPNNDWLRQELAYALKKDKNIIPIFLNGVKGFPNDLPSDIAKVSKKNGPEYNRYYFNDFYKKIKRDFLKSKPYKKHLKIWGVLSSIVILGFILFSTIYFHKSSEIKDYNDLSYLVEEFNDQISNYHNAQWALFSDNPFLAPTTTERESNTEDDEFNKVFSNRMTYKGKLYLSKKPYSTSYNGHPEIVTINLYGPNAGVYLFSIVCEKPLNSDINSSEIAKQLGFVDILSENHEMGYDKVIYKKDSLYLCLINSYGSGGEFPTIYFSIDKDYFQSL